MRLTRAASLMRIIPVVAAVRMSAAGMTAAALRAAMPAPGCMAAIGVADVRAGSR